MTPQHLDTNSQTILISKKRPQDIEIKLSEKLANSTINEACDNNTALKLPRITMPTFDGSYANWRQFHDLFVQMVHNQPMSGCQKMWYLKTNLTGEAEKLIRHLSLSNENYESAWSMLKSRYDNTRLLVNALLTKLTSQPRLSFESATALKQLHDTTKEALMGLDNLQVPTTNWDPLVLHLLMGKLDRQTHMLYEQSLSQPKSLQSLSHFLEFLETRFQSLEALGHKARAIEEKSTKVTAGSRKFNTLVSTPTAVIKCIVCSQNHQLYACPEFLQLEPHGRLRVLKNGNLCINCMKAGHTPADCTSRGCKICFKKHNTLVHLKQGTPGPVPTKLDPKKETSGHTVALTANQMSRPQGHVVLSTVMVRLVNNEGKHVECRALLDSGSQLNFITERVVKKLGLFGTPHVLQVRGIGQAKQQSQKRVSVLMQSRINEYSTRFEASILKQIVPPQPSQSIDTDAWPIPKNIQLSDLNFNKPGEIDALIGAEYFYQLLCVGQINLGPGLPIIQKTVLGWVISGRISQQAAEEPVCCILNEDMNQQLEKFWRLEEAEGEQRMLTASERKCEEHFNNTVRRSNSGRFIVRLPFTEDSYNLGKSRYTALRRFLSLERRFERDPEFHSQYTTFMEEYERLGHMEEININGLKGPHYFIPHHGVSKPDSTTTKLRVVFDASCKTSSNLSLNDILATGPTVQDELFTILLRFRLPRFVFTADIEKMYRQILIDENERRLQLIIWRDRPNKPLKYYQLNTVTYGTTAAPYLATKCLQRLAQDNSVAYPLGADIVAKNFYVDDVMAGANSLTEATEMQRQVKTLLSEAGFVLRKWCSNHPTLLKDIPPSERELQITVHDSERDSIKVLGLIWQPATDFFRIKVTWIDNSPITKRTVCSDVARIFDPLGVMAPVVITAKLFLQELWSLKMDWDASLPFALHTRWSNYRQSLHNLNNVTFSRHVLSPSAKGTQIHIFADASQRAYGAAIYVRSLTKDNQPIVRLLCAKSRVAPIKQVTLPRLELCAAKLATELATRVKAELCLKEKPTFFWTGSEIVLAWINPTFSL